jgi:hypothetical protein
MRSLAVGLTADQVLEASFWLIDFLKLASSSRLQHFNMAQIVMSPARLPYQMRVRGAPHLFCWLPLFRARVKCGEYVSHSMLLGPSNCLFVTWLVRHESRMRYEWCLPRRHHISRLVI